MMSSSQRTENDLLALAKKQLLVGSASVPKPFLAELKKHTSIFPDDINATDLPTQFELTPQPGSGFGYITCLEQGCNGLKIPLTRSNMASDGGKKEGVGSLMAYREHIHAHPTHKTSRKVRLSQGASPAGRSLSERSSSGSSSSSGKSRLKLVSVIGKTGVSEKPSSPGIAITKERSSGLQFSSDLASPLNFDVSRSRLNEDFDGRLGEEAPPFHVSSVPGPKTISTTAVGDLIPAKKLKGGPRIPFALHDDNKPVESSSPMSTLLVTPLPEPPSSSITAQPPVPATPMTSGEDLGMIIGYRTPGQTQIIPYPGDVPLARAISDEMVRWRGPVNQAASFLQPYPPATLSKAVEESGDDEDSPSSSDTDDTPGRLLRGMDHLSNMPSQSLDEDVYNMGRTAFRDPLGRVEDLHEFFQNAGNAEQFDTNASVTDALERLELPNLSVRFPGLTISLMPHQVIGVAWMLDKERSIKNKGGILSDEMGLGKTVQMIATIMANRSDDPAVKTTLILAPLALLGQWQLEIEMKTNDGLSVHIYHGTGKAKSKKTLQKADVVLTTYGTLAQEWFDAETYEKEKEMQALGKTKKKRKRSDGFIASDNEDERSARKKVKQKSGLLFTMKWYRVVLDEAQFVRNRRTRNSKAVTELDATYRWCLTGTPIINGLEDAYGLLRFLQIRPWYDWDDFNNHIAGRARKEPNLCSARLQAIFATCLLRRKKDTKLDGKKLIELPPKDVQLLKLEFSTEEREIYTAVETRSQMTFNRYLRAGTVLKNYSHVLVMLLRLRQICTHTSLITEDEGVIVDDDLDNMDEARRDDMIKAYTEMGREFVNSLEKLLRDRALEHMAAEKKSAEAAIGDEDICALCMGPFTDPVATSCKHFYCRECIETLFQEPPVDDAALRQDERSCPMCRQAISKNKLFSRAAFEPTDEELNVGQDPVKQEEAQDIKPEDDEMPDVASLLNNPPSSKKLDRKIPKGKARRTRRKGAKRVVLDSDEEDDDEYGDGDDLKDFIVPDGDVDDEEWRPNSRPRKRYRASVNYEESESEESDDDNIVLGRKDAIAETKFAPIKALSKLLPSAKMKHMMNNLETWAKERPDEKTMVVSQWTQALDLVSDYLARKGIAHVRFQGNMSREKRDKAVRIFMKKSDATVMLMSLKCGGVGLNLTRANRVISLDLGWSEAVEGQAFDRVHRLGQIRPVFVERLVISNTVEDRVLALQERKKNLADGSLGEGNGRKFGRLTVRELANLFGLDQYGKRMDG